MKDGRKRLKRKDATFFILVAGPAGLDIWGFSDDDRRERHHPCTDCGRTQSDLYVEQMSLCAVQSWANLGEQSMETMVLFLRSTFQSARLRRT